MFYSACMRRQMHASIRCINMNGAARVQMHPAKPGAVTAVAPPSAGMPTETTCRGRTSLWPCQQPRSRRPGSGRPSNTSPHTSALWLTFIHVHSLPLFGLRVAARYWPLDQSPRPDIQGSVLFAILFAGRLAGFGRLCARSNSWDQPLLNARIMITTLKTSTFSFF